jgi:flagellar hook-associated protein 2
MATITGLSTGSINVTSVVSQIMAAEQKPLNNLTTKQTSYNTQLSAYSTVKSNLSTLKSAMQSLLTTSGFKAYSVALSDPTVLSASAASNAVSGNYNLEVSSLAQSQQLIADGQADSKAAIGTGASTTLSFNFGTISYDPNNGGAYDTTTGKYTNASFISNGSTVKTVTIDSSNNTLEGIRDAINNANIGVTATIINDGSGTPYRLALGSGTSGASNAMSISVSGDSAISNLLSNDPTGTQNLTQTMEAKNANLKVNGVAISKSSNIVSDAIQGVTLTLNKVTTSPVNVAVSKNTSSITDAANSFISAYNTLYSSLKSLSAYKTTSSSGGALSGDGTINQLLGEMRTIVGDTYSGTDSTFTTLASVGITTSPGVGLVLDSTKFGTAVTNDLNGLTNLFTSSSGFATRLSNWAKSSLNVTVNTRTSNINDALTNVGKKITAEQARLNSLQNKYTTQFSNLNAVLSQMSSESSFITQNLG